MKILACFKWVIDEAYIRALSDLNNLGSGLVEYKISDYDRHALEEAVRIRERLGAEVTAVTVGSSLAGKGVKDALARGADKALWISDPDFDHLEPAQTARILADAISAKLEFDLILCGEGSSDLYARQVGPRLAEHLGIPSITSVCSLTVVERRIEAERSLEERRERAVVALPALVTVLPDINQPRIPGVRDTLAAAKKPVVTIGVNELGGKYEARLQAGELRKNVLERDCRKFGTEAEEIERLASILYQSLRK